MRWLASAESWNYVSGSCYWHIVYSHFPFMSTVGNGVISMIAWLWHGAFSKWDMLIWKTLSSFFVYRIFSSSDIHMIGYCLSYCCLFTIVFLISSWNLRYYKLVFFSFSNELILQFFEPLASYLYKWIKDIISKLYFSLSY